MKTLQEQIEEKLVYVSRLQAFVDSDSMQPKVAEEYREIVLKQIMQLITNREEEIDDFILTALRSYRMRFPDATYDDAIGVVMGFKLTKNRGSE